MELRRRRREVVRISIAWLVVTMFVSGTAVSNAAPPQGDPSATTYQSLLTLFDEWRAFETPPLREGAPDYTAATFAKRHAELPAFRRRLDALDEIAASGWSIEQQVDREL